MKTLLFIYLIGALIGFGLAYTITSSSQFDPEKIGMSRGKILSWGFWGSWITILVAIWGFLRGLSKAISDNGGNDDDR